MHVPGVGSGPPAAEFSNALLALAGPKGSGLHALAASLEPGDTISSLLGELSEMGAARLLQIIDRPLTPEIETRLKALLRASVSDVTQGNLDRALIRLAEFASLDPRRVETLETETGLASIRPQVGRLLFQLATTARLDAEARLEQARTLSQTAESNDQVGNPAGQEIRPEIAILLAGRLLEAGGYANCIHSTELSQLSINQYGWASAAVPLPAVGSKDTPPHAERTSLELLKRWASSMRRLWLRAPLLVLLLAWLAVGVSAGCISALLRNYWPRTNPGSVAALGFETWGVGFLALILFALYVSVRYPRR